MDAVEAVLHLTGTWTAEARVLAKYDPEKARMVERMAAAAREAVEANAVPWVPLAEVARRTGYSADTLRTKAKALRPQGLARKMGGTWHFERGAALKIRPKGRRAPIRPDEMRDVDTLARRLAAEE
ncbi:MAG: hypothetical protein RQ751_11645 [Longimicrobiales bacterium]|nr:hypothetical protein [Longimicrobiales bacterium]